MSREAFEAFVKRELGDIAVMDEGRYISPKIQKYWLTWQAASAQVPADRDAERWRWWMSDAPKDLNGFMQGVREHWTMDQWNAWVDAEMLAAELKEPKP